MASAGQDGPVVDFSEPAAPQTKPKPTQATASPPPIKRPQPSYAPPPPKRRSAWVKLLWTLIVMVVILIGLVAYSLLVRQQRPTPAGQAGITAPADRLDSLEQRLNDLEQRLKALESKKRGGS